MEFGRVRTLGLSAMFIFAACALADNDADESEVEHSASVDTAVAPTRIEAEGMTRVGYDIAASVAASGGSFVRLSSGATTGTLTKAFPGNSDTYDIYVGHFDENDGASKFELRVANSLVASWTASENKASEFPSAFTRDRRLVLSNRALTKGDSVQVKGTFGNKEFAPFDYIEFVPVSPGPGIATRPSNPSCVAPPRPAVGDGTLELRRFGSDLTFNLPMRVDQPANDPAGNRLYVAERDGAVWSIPKAQGATNAQKKLEFSIGSLSGALPVNAVGSGGLLGIAFHPQFATNGHVFLSYTTTGPTGATNEVRSLIARVTKNFVTKTWGGYRTVLGPFNQPKKGHSGGGLHFGPVDGLLYATFGDGGTSDGDLLGNGQKRTGFFSKLLRIRVSTTNGGAAYTIPADNPWPAGEGGFQPEAFAYGFRNPFRMGIDRQTGEIWIGDVGRRLWEEIDRVSKGGNFGWNIREGAHCSTPATGCQTAGLIDPVYEYPHVPSQTDPPSDVTGASVIGGTVVRNAALGPDVQGRYIFGDYLSTKVWTRSQSPTVKITEVPVRGGGQQWVSFDTDASGDIYGVALVSGEIYKLAQPEGPDPSPADYPTTLTETGCFGVDPKIPSPALIPYDINSPLWSDGADKDRFFAIPDGTKINVNADGDLDFPPGSVTVKTFSIGGKKVETRFFVRHMDGGWAGYTYEWNTSQTQATLLKTNKTRVTGDRDWYFPSRSECSQCHTGAAGSTLGLEIKQLNRNFLYSASNINSNQVETWKHLALFANPPGAASSLGAYPDPLGGAALGSRARSYLHSNCSMCHQPNGGAGNAAFDARFATPFGAGPNTTNMCNVVPSDTLGIANARLIAPGNPGQSVILQRTLSANGERMPPMGTSFVHVGGTDTLRNWITSLTGCP